MMKTIGNTIIIGIDHGYGNMKTANCCFPTGVGVYDKEPAFKENLLVWNGRYYLISEEHKEFSAEKMLDDDYYVLTLVAIARELNIAKLYSADVYIAAGLPLTWVSEQKEEFMKYLLHNETVDYAFKGKEYHIRIVGADVFAQGYAAVRGKQKKKSQRYTAVCPSMTIKRIRSQVPFPIRNRFFGTMPQRTDTGISAILWMMAFRVQPFLARILWKWNAWWNQDRLAQSL